MYGKMTAYIQERISISHEELDSNLSYFQLQTFAKGDYLLKTNQYCRFIGFLNEGLIVSTIADGAGVEKASDFIYPGCFFTYTEGLNTDIPSHKNIVALEDCEVLMMRKADLPVILNNLPKFEGLLNLMLAEEIKKLMLNEQSFKTISLEQRYLNLEKQYPNAFQKIPLKYLADYLGIEAPSLSRLRKRIAKARN
jgi:CRP/FNR family transcriptional regulator, anaerobic regulatory protein